ncbi:MAG: aldo/keto reductase [Candidatus Aenigmarchaeota archaeon]|nr:aldo/keto reductase [Candidatus Aenigmarchaeota archaeon]
MEYRRLGRTNLKVSVIGVGGGAFMGPNKTPDLVKKVISFAVKKGVNFIETGEDYDESKVGLALKEVRKKIILASKSTAYEKKRMEVSLENSFKKLGTDHIDIYMLQTVTTVDGLKLRIENGVLDVLKKAKEEGSIDFIGLTGHRIPTLIEAIKLDEFDVVEAPYCIGQYETEMLFEFTEKYDVGVIAITPFAGGILVDRDKKTKAAGFMNSKNALGYVLSNTAVSMALVGMSSVEHAKENIEAIESGKDFSEADREKILKNTEDFLGLNFCRSCKACMPCDVHGWKFNIDNFLRFEAFYSKYGYKQFAKEYFNLDQKADACTGCGKCEPRCPYGIPIREMLKKTHKLLSSKQ